MINYESFKDKIKDRANKLICYYEGDQIRYVKNILSGKVDGMGERHQWKERGFIPRVRNITNVIVDKSDNLFNRPPKLEIWKDGAKTPVVDDTFNSLMYQADWLEFFQNLSSYTRLLKTTIMLLQKYVPTERTTEDGVYKFDKEMGDALILTMLHEGNSCVETTITGNIKELAFILDKSECEEYYEEGDEEKDVWYYRKITPEEIIDVKVYESEYGEEPKEIVVSEDINADGIVPAVFFYDTNRPRKGCWNRIPEDLESLQEFYNLHLTDLEFAIAHQKQKTLFTDADIEEDTSGTFPHATKGYTPAGEVYEEVDQQSGGSGSIGGLGEVVKLNADGMDRSPMVKFDGPESDLAQLDSVVKDLVIQVAQDWSVNLKVAGEGSATSGFQLVVEEIDNLQLREQRGQMFQAGMRKMYEILQILYPELTDGTLLVEFAPPNLPVNHKEQEQVWSLKIGEGRASRIDYFMEVHGMSKEEAQKKIEEIDQLNEVIQTVPDFTETL